MNRRKFPVNLKGRDFVIGDLHGAFERLMQLLEHVNFDFDNDRLFSVGDLVDRGPDNEACLRLMREKWFFPVRSNHGDLMYDYFTDSTYGPWWAPNGGAWGLHYKFENSDDAIDMRDLVEMDNQLPFMITVDLQNGKSFHVIHAELYGLKPLTDDDLDNDAKFEEAAFHFGRDGQHIVWGRYIFEFLYGAVLDDVKIRKFKNYHSMEKVTNIFNDKLSHIYSGHTVVRSPVRYKGQTNLDTCAFKSFTTKEGDYTYKAPEWAGLTMTEPLTDKFWIATETGVRENTLVVIGDKND